MNNIILYNAKNIYLGYVDTINTNAYVGEDNLKPKVIKLKKTGIDSNGVIQYEPLETPNEYYNIHEVKPLTNYMLPYEPNLLTKKKINQIVKRTGMPEVSKVLSKKIAS